MRAFVLAVLASATLASVAPARASAEQLAYAWYQRSGAELIDVNITAHQWSDGSRYVSVAIDRYNWRLRDPVVESLRCDLDRVSFVRYSGDPVVIHVDVPDGSVVCYDQHANRWKSLYLRASWDLWEDLKNFDRQVSAEAYIRSPTAKGLFVYVYPSDPALSPDVTGY